MEIQGENIMDGGNVSCAWGQTINTSDRPQMLTTTYYKNESYTSCLSPSISEQLINVTLILNGYIETNSYLTVQIVNEPVLTSITPARAVMGQNTTLSFRGEYMKNTSSAPLCRFTRGEEVVGYSPLYMPSPVTGQCDVPQGLTPVKEIHEVLSHKSCLTLTNPHPTSPTPILYSNLILIHAYLLTVIEY